MKLTTVFLEQQVKTCVSYLDFGRQFLFYQLVLLLHSSFLDRRLLKRKPKLAKDRMN